MKLLAGACLLLPAFFAGAAVPVELQRIAGAQSCGVIAVTATPVCSAGDCPGAMTTKDGMTLDLSSSEEWSVTAKSTGCWAPVLNVRRDATSITIPIWPQRTLTGRLTVPEGADVPSSITVQIESPPQQATARVPQSQFSCPVSKTSFRCTIPTAMLDVRVAATGFVPRYFWGLDKANLGEIALTRGGSVAGTIRFNGDGPPLTGVALEMRLATPPLMDEGWSFEEKRLASRTVASRPNAHGFFQFAQVEPGQYTVTARQEGWSRARHAGIEVKDGEESLLPHPLVIEPLSEVDVVIQPPLDPYGKPWQVSLTEMVPLSSLSTPIVETEASLTGAWSAAGIDSGFHRIDVMDHRGSKFTYSIVDISPRMAPVLITMSSVLVRGTLHVGEAPHRARLEFRNGKGTRIAMRSDAEGRFSGALPQDGEWQIDVISGRAPNFQRLEADVRAENGIAQIDLALPDTRIAGKVVSANGEPATAFVRFWSEEKTYLGGTSTDEKGVFRFVGIEPGAVYLEAESRASQNAKSGYIPLTITSTPTDDLTVVLRRAARLKARLITASGIPVAGAIVRYTLPDRPRESMEEVSGPDGRFTISLSPGTPAVDLAVLPPALPVKIGRVPLSEDSARTTEIVLGRSAGTLEIQMDHATPDGPGSQLWIEHDGAIHHVATLNYPSNWTSFPRGFRPWGESIEIEAGEYQICGDRVKRDRCVRKVVAPGAIERVDGRALLK